MFGIVVALIIALVVLLHPAIAQAQLRGHGGPVRALAVSADGTTAISGSFDTSAIRWSLTRNAAEQVLRFHESAVNAVAIAARWPHRHRRRGRQDRGVAAGRADAGAGARGPRRADRQRSRCRPTARRIASGVVGPHRPALAARRRRAARARRPFAKRQRRGLHARRQVAGQRRLRPDAAHLAARRRRADHRHAADAAQCGRGRARRRDRRRRRRRHACSSCRRPASSAASSTAARRRSSASRCRPTARWSPRPASAARSRSSTARTRTLARTLVGPGPAGVVGGVPAGQPHAA